MAERVAESPERFALSELVSSALLRIVTNPRAFQPPTELAAGVEFLDRIRTRPQCVLVRPGARHWGLFVELCTRTQAKGKLIADAYHAALAIEHGCEWISTDADFARFPDLRWSHPLRP